MDSTTSSVILYILLPAGIAFILLVQPFTKRFLDGDADQRSPRAHVESAPKFIRISGVPQDWTEEDILNGLLAVEPTCILRDQDPKITLYPACCGAGQTGLLNLGKCTGLFEYIKAGQTILKIPKLDSIATVVIDSHFHDLTPLNTPGNDILADVVAVVGLGGHAFGTWRSRKTGEMWLKDFLPRDVKRIRIFSYGYDSQSVGNHIDEDILDYRRNFLQMLENARRTAETRPIIFIAHDIGGLLILQALLQSKQEHQNTNVFNSTRAIFFFGTPHQGLKVESLLQMVEDVSQGDSSARKSLIKQLDESSNLMSMQRDAVIHLLGQASDIEVISFYETKATPGLEKTASGRWVRGGPLFHMVKRNVALLLLPSEHRIPVGQNHFDMVKFYLDVDRTYQTVVTYMNRCLDKIAKKQNARNIALARECLKSLNRVDCETYRDNQLSKRHGTSCSWIFSDKHYRSWLGNQDHPILWVHGGPGFGKTVMSSVLTDRIPNETDISFGKGHSVAYFFFDDQDESLRTSHALLSNLLAQLLSQDPNARVHFAEERDYKLELEKTEWNLGMLWRVFIRILKDDKINPVFLIIDALDECEKQTRISFLEKLRHIFQGSDSRLITQRIKIFVTSRPHIRVDSYFPNVIKLSLEAYNGKDISDYVHSSVDELEKRTFPIHLRNEIKKALIEGSNGMFLWVFLILFDLKTSTDSSPFAIRKKLKSLPEDLPNLYNRILLNINVDDVEAANNILRWVVWAKRPLSLQELKIAVAIRPEQTSMSKISEKMRCDLETDLYSILGPLIDIRDGLVYLVHQSAKAYLKNMKPIACNAISALSDESNLYISTCCLAYLSFDEFHHEPVDHGSFSTNKGLTEIRRRCEEFPFLLYCGMHWHYHVRQLDEKLHATPLLLNMFLRLATSKQKFNLWYEIYNSSKNRFFRYMDPFEITINFGLICFLQALLDNEGSVESRVNADETPLLMAIEHGNDTIVRYLVDNGADVNAQGGRYGNPLQAAATEDAGIVRYLVENGASVNARDGLYGSPLQAAATKDIEIVRYLVGKGADVNTQGGYYGNPLQAAATKDVEIVRYLVGKGADVNAQGGYYGNPLQAAATKDIEIVRFLVENGADVNAQGGIYGSPLQAASAHRLEKTVRYLVKNLADVNAQGGLYGSPLQAASAHVLEDRVHHLVENRAGINAQDSLYGGPLNATATQDFEILRYLVENGAGINPQGGGYSNTLSAAKAKDHNRIVRFLLEHGANRITKDGS